MLESPLPSEASFIMVPGVESSQFMSPGEQDARKGSASSSPEESHQNIKVGLRGCASSIEYSPFNVTRNSLGHTHPSTRITLSGRHLHTRMTGRPQALVERYEHTDDTLWTRMDASVACAE